MDGFRPPPLLPGNGRCSNATCASATQNPETTSSSARVEPLTDGSDFSLDLRAESGAFSAYWMSPTDGREVGAGLLDGGQVHQFTDPPFDGDFVLLVKRDSTS